MIEVLGRIFSIVGLVLGIIGTVKMGKGLLLSDKAIESISGTYFDKNKFLQRKLLEDREDARFGLFLLAVGFAIQIFSEALMFF